MELAADPFVGLAPARFSSWYIFQVASSCQISIPIAMTAISLVGQDHTRWCPMGGSAESGWLPSGIL